MYQYQIEDLKKENEEIKKRLQQKQLQINRLQKHIGRLETYNELLQIKYARFEMYFMANIDKN